MAAQRTLAPTGQCWCEQPNGSGSFFQPGHDRVAESTVVTVEYGGVPELLAAHGYGPGGKNPRRERDDWESSGNRVQ